MRVKSLRLGQTPRHEAEVLQSAVQPCVRRSGWWLITGFTGKTGFSSSSNYQVCCRKQRHAVLPNTVCWVAGRWAVIRVRGVRVWGRVGGGLTGRHRQRVGQIFISHPAPFAVVLANRQDSAEKDRRSPKCLHMCIHMFVFAHTTHCSIFFLVYLLHFFSNLGRIRFRCDRETQRRCLCCSVSKVISFS